MGKKSRFAKKKVDDVDAMLPFMSLLLIIIPSLISNVSFYHLKSVDVSVPGLSENTPQKLEDVPEEKKKTKNITARIEVYPRSIKLEILNEDDASVMAKVKKAADKEGAIAIFNALQKVKRSYHKLETILVSSHQEVLYEDLVKVLSEFKRSVEEFDKNGEPAQESSYLAKLPKPKADDYFQFKIVLMPAQLEQVEEAGV